MHELSVKRSNLRRLAFLLGIVLFGTIGLIAQPSSSFSNDSVQPVIMIDPGHGGQDNGAKGPDGTLEKNVSLALANLIAENLSDKYRPVLTRNDDYGLGAMERTSIANAANASFFISIHTGGNYKYKTSGIMVFFFKEVSDNRPKPEETGSFMMDDPEMKITWDEIQQKHAASSMEAAEAIHDRLSQNMEFSQSQVFGEPLLVLIGANMPAILIEVGYLTDPAEEKKLNNNRYLSYLAQEISRGIDDFFQRGETRSELQE